MDISTLSGLLPTARIQQNSERTADRIQAAVASLVTGTKANQASDDIASVALATQLQSDNSTLRSAIGNLAQASSLLEVAAGGIDQSAQILQRLQQLATQANSGTLSESARAGLNEEFQQLTAELDRLSTSTQFGGNSLLDGSLTGENALTIDGILVAENTGEESLSALTIGSLSSSSLFGGVSLDLLSQGNAADALNVVGNALNQVVSARANVGSFAQSVNFVSANLESAIFNQEAARSSLTDTDFAGASTDLAQLLLKSDINTALTAQGNRLAPTLLQLIG